MAQTSDPSITLGRSYFEAGNYAAAEDCFKRAAQMNFDSPEAHYWYATALAKRMKGPQAIKEYRACLALGPEPVLASYCTQALAAYHAPIPPGFIGTAPSKPASAHAAPAATQDEQFDIQRRQASARIDDNTAADIGRLKERDTQWQTTKEQEAAQAGERLREEGRRKVARMESEGYIGSHGELKQYTPQELNRVKEEYEHKAMYAQDVVQREAQSAHQHMNERQSALSESAANLQNQMFQSPNGRSPSLQPLGTNLYVRNYLVSGQDQPDDNSKSNAPPARAVAQSLTPGKRQTLSPDSAIAKATSKSQSSGHETTAPQVQTSVKGKLLTDHNP
jgi:tetratricopeptide (TPR) repeat protein